MITRLVHLRFDFFVLGLQTLTVSTTNQPRGQLFHQKLNSNFEFEVASSITRTASLGASARTDFETSLCYFFYRKQPTPPPSVADSRGLNKASGKPSLKLFSLSLSRSLSPKRSPHIPTSVTRKKSPNAYKNWPKMILLEK